MFNNLLNRKHNIHVTLKSGKTISFRCTTFSIDKTGNTITGLDIKGCDKYFYIRLDEIAAITQD